MKAWVLPVLVLCAAAGAGVAWYLSKHEETGPANGPAAPRFEPPPMAPAEVLKRLRSSVALRRAGKLKEAQDALRDLKKSAQDLLAVLEGDADDEAKIGAALLLLELDDPAILAKLGPLLKKKMPDEAKMALLELLVNHKFAGAAEDVRALLFASEASSPLKERSVQFFGAIGDVGTLKNVFAVPGLKPFQVVAAESLATIGTHEAATALYQSWEHIFADRKDDTHYRVIQQIAKFRPEILEEFFAKGTQESDPNKCNYIISSLRHAPPELAYRLIDQMLSKEAHPRGLQQAIFVLRDMAGSEAEATLARIAGNASEDGFEAAKALLARKASVDAVRKSLETQTDPAVRAILLCALSSDPTKLTSQETQMLLDDCGKRIKSQGPDRHLAINTMTNLAGATPDPAGTLLNIYNGLSGAERRQHNEVFRCLADRADDERVRPVVEATLSDEGLGMVPRLALARGLAAKPEWGEKLYAMISSTKNADLANEVAGVVLEQQGRAAAGRLNELAEKLSDTRAKYLRNLVKNWEQRQK